MITEKQKRTVRFASDIENSNGNIVNEIDSKIKKVQHQKRVVPTFDINDIKTAINRGKSAPQYFDTTRDMIGLAKSPNHRYEPYQSISRFTTPIKFSELVEFNKKTKVNALNTAVLKPISQETNDESIVVSLEVKTNMKTTATAGVGGVDVKAEIPYLVRVLKEGATTEREAALDKLMILAAIGEHRSRLYKYGIMAPLLDIMSKGSAAAYPNAARALMNLSAVVENKIAMFQDPSLIPSILNLLKSCSNEAMKSGLGTLYNLAMPLENKVAMYNHKDFMLRMSTLMQQQDSVIQERVCGVLKQLSVVDELAVPMFKYKGVFTCIKNIILNTCKSGISTLSGRENASGVLYNLTQCVALRVPVLKTGLIPGMISILSAKGSWELRQNIIGIFFQLCIPVVSKISMFNEGVIAPVSAVLANVHCDLETKRRGVGMLLQLSFAPETRMTLVNDSKYRAVHVLVGMLQLPADAEECIGWAAGCLLNMAEPAEGRGTIFLAGAVPPLIKLLQHVGDGDEASIAVRENAAGALANLSIAVENKVPMFEGGVVQSILQFLKDRTLSEYNMITTTPLAQEKAIWTIGNLVRCNSIRQQMLQLGILVALVESMDHGTIMCKQYATAAVMRLSDEDGNEPILLAGGVIRPLVALVDSESSVIAQDAVEALFNLCIDDSCRLEAKNRGLTREKIGWQDLF